jgi:glycyl-tRNA synthetase beta chain
MTIKNLLVELLVEELPPKSLKKLGESFAHGLLAGLKAQNLLSDNSVVTEFATPRRLGAHISAVHAQAPTQAVSHKLMPVSVGLLPDGQASPALLKKLASLGLDAAVLPQLKQQPDGKANALFIETQVAGPSLAEGLQKTLLETIAKLPVAKLMQYQLADGWTSVNFVRPAHGLVALWGAEVLNVSVLGLSAGRQTQGHRFEAQMNPVMLLDADHYAHQMLDQGAVVASFSARQADISRQLHALAHAQGLAPIEDAALLEEVTALVERPHVLLCQFEPEFLAVPPECLILTMKANQKYFPLLDAKGHLSHQFLVVSNISPADTSNVVGGNERVVRPRLADAQFFFDQDRQKTLADRVPGLEKVVYHGKLGTQGQRILRVRALAKKLGEHCGGQVLSEAADTAAHLAKADLLTDMVGEFPELQGTMGRYYALHDGLSADIAYAIEDHYKPRFAGDELPRNPTGVMVALADKCETLVGLFGVGQVPNGDKDPFALRRHALGVVRLLVEKSLPVSLNTLLQWAFDAAAPLPLKPDTVALVADFIFERFAGALREQGYSAQEVDAVVALRPQQLFDVSARLAAVRAFAAMPQAASLAAANKRVGNILKKSQEVVRAERVDEALLSEPAEKTLHTALSQVKPLADAAFEGGDFTASLQALAALKEPVDSFFESVMVNVESPTLRANRQSLLAHLHQAMNRVADLSKLA